MNGVHRFISDTDVSFNNARNRMLLCYDLDHKLDNHMLAFRAGRIVRDYLFARFAYNIFTFAEGFLIFRLVPRKALWHHINDDGPTDLQGPIDVNSAELIAAFGGSTKNASPQSGARRPAAVTGR
ncbi:hypothetical protein GGR51DRAFT_561452 [Nemania sp. FL0031]|nr:hypothetical protein GGR51DRAFT_561452 [Nemania sp. FL0031]